MFKSHLINAFKRHIILVYKYMVYVSYLRLFKVKNQISL